MGKKRNKRVLQWYAKAMLAVLTFSTLGQGLPAVTSATTLSESTKTSSSYKTLKKENEENKKKIEKEEKQKLDANLKAQLEAKGFDTSTLKENGSENEQEVRMIVELSGNSASAKLGEATGSAKSVQAIDSASDKVIKSQSSVQKEVEKLTGNKVRQSFGYLVNGFSVDAKYSDLEKIKALDGVKNVTVATVYYPTSVDSNQLANVQQVWEKHKLKGEGMVVSIIDSGIDPSHKDLRLSDTTKEKISLEKSAASVSTLGYGKTFTDKVPYGHNYADNNNTIVDNNPGTDMHGMHVAGIVAANGEGDDPTKAVLGVAPEAQLLAMKVFPNNTRIATALNDDIIAAIEDSVKLGADVLNMSLGSVSGTVDANDPEQTAIRNAAEKGVLSVISAGNSATSTSNSTSGNPKNLFGTVDTSTVGSPGVATEALTVASSENTLLTSKGLTVYSVDDANNKTLEKIDSSTSPTGAIPFSNPTSADLSVLTTAHELVVAGVGKESDYDNLDVKGKIVLVKRGELTFSDKQKYAKARGAVGIMVYNNAANSAPVGMSIDDLDFLTIGLTQEDGENIVKLAQEKKGKFSFETGTYQFKNPDYGKMSDFSSWGPTPDLELKPEISAPGGEIYSLANNNNYQTMSGTSMSSPFVAGSEALIYQALKQSNTALSGINLINFAKVSTMNTATPMYDVNHSGSIISPRRQGAGQIKVDQAIENRTSLTDAADGDGALALKNIDTQKEFSVTLTNNDTKEATYKFSNFGGAYTESSTASGEVYDSVIDGATVSADQDTVKLAAGESKTVTIKLALPSSFAKNQFVEGYIQFTSDENPTLTMPYLGFYGNYGDAAVLDTPSYDSSSILGKGYFIDGSSYYLGLQDGQFNPDKNAISPDGDGYHDEAYPALYFLRNAESATYEVVDANGKVIRKLDEEKKIRKDYFNPSAGRFTTHYATGATWDGTVYNTKTGKAEVVKDGQYQMKITTKATVEGANAQTTYLPIKVDTQAPEISDMTFETVNGQQVLKLKVTDNLSGAYLKNIALLVNGVVKSYDVSKQTGETIEIPLDASQLPKDGSNKVALLVEDFAGNQGFKEQTIKQGTANNLLLFNLKEGQVITSATADYSDTTKSFTASGSYPKEAGTLYANGVEVNHDADTFDVDIPVDEATKTIVFSTDKEQKQVLKTINVEVHTTLPDLAITEPSTENVSVNATSYKLSGKAGQTVKKLMITNVATGEAKDITSAIQTDGTFTAEVGLVSGNNILVVYATDQYGNDEAKSVTVTNTQPATSTDKVVFDNIQTDNITAIGVGNKDYNEKESTYTVTGHLSQKVAHFTINGQEVSYDPDTLKFTYKLSVKQGKQSVAVYLQDDALNNGKPLVDEGYYVYVDTVLPSLDLDNLQVGDNGDYYVNTNQNPFHVTGHISDNFSGYKLSINNENVYTDTDYDYFNEDFFKGKAAANFDHAIQLQDGKNILTATLTDSMGNQQQKHIIVDYKKAELAVPTVTPDTKEVTNKEVVLTATAEQDATILYSLDGTNYAKYTEPLHVSSNQHVLFKAVDKYGNESAVNNYEVTNIVKEIAANPVVSVQYPKASKTTDTNKNSKVKNVASAKAAVTDDKTKEYPVVTIGYDKELSDAQKAYTFLQYSLDGGNTFNDYTVPFAVNKTTTVVAKAKDKAGNESKAVQVLVTVESETPTPTDPGTAETTLEPTSETTSESTDTTSSQTETTSGSTDTTSGQTATTSEDKTSTTSDSSATNSSTQEGSSSTSTSTHSVAGNTTTSSAGKTSTKSGARGQTTSSLPQTGESKAKPILIICGLVLIGLAGYFFVKKKK